ncbi:hypothetical protein LPJ64_002418, partial [Coemansia asiatica]
MSAVFYEENESDLQANRENEDPDCSEYDDRDISSDGKHGHSLQDEAEQEEDAETDDNDYDDIKDDIDSHSYPSSIREIHAGEAADEYDGWSEMVSEVSSNSLSDSFDEHGFSDDSSMVSFVNGPPMLGKQYPQSGTDNPMHISDKLTVASSPFS